MDYIIKLLIFGLFVAILYYVIDLFMGYLNPYLDLLSFTPLLCQLGVFQALNIYLSFLISGWFVRNIISFWK